MGALIPIRAAAPLSSALLSGFDLAKRALCALVLLCIGCQAAYAKKEQPLTAVADLRYGAALYHYYLDDYMSAMTELLIAKERGGIDGHGDNPEIMEGGLAMGYAMERYASDIFDRLLEDNRSVEARDAAWFYLARLRYTHGEWARAEEALNKISPKPVKRLREDLNAMRINVVLKQDRPDEAAQLLTETKVARRWLPYFTFNIGSAYARVGNYQRSVIFFSRFADDDFQKEFDVEEQRALYDKAMTAAGFSYLFLKEYAKAKDYFSRVRLSSSLKNRALLGYGWAAVELGDYKEALKPWLHLANSPLVDENNQEALIAVPYAYEKMGAESLALQYYQRAENSFVLEIDKIDDVLASLETEDLLGALKIEARGELDWMAIAEEKQLSPRLTYLVRLFSKDRFQASIYELQDLLALRDDLIAWQDKLAFYYDMIDTREASRGEKADFLQVATLKERIESMKAERAAYAKQVEDIATNKAFFELSTEDEQDLIKRAERSLDNVDKLRETDPFVDEYDEAARRYYGLLMWQVSETYGDRLWQLIKKVNALDDVIEELSDTEARISSLMSQAPDLDPFKVKMDDANNKLMELNVRVDDVIRKNEVDLRSEVAAVLKTQRVRLLNYLAQSRLSVARIYDKARNKQEEAEFEKLKAEAEEEKRLKSADKEASTASPKNSPEEFIAPTLENIDELDISEELQPAQNNSSAPLSDDESPQGETNESLEVEQ